MIPDTSGFPSKGHNCLKREKKNDGRLISVKSCILSREKYGNSHDEGCGDFILI
jgi:hypothetical protein